MLPLVGTACSLFYIERDKRVDVLQYESDRLYGSLVIPLNNPSAVRPFLDFVTKRTTGEFAIKLSCLLTFPPTTYTNKINIISANSQIDRLLISPGVCISVNSLIIINPIITVNSSPA